MSVLLKRHAKVETITVKALSTIDKQGKPTYASAGVSVSAVVRRADSVVRSASGEDIQTFATVYIDGEQTTFPGIDDRVELADGLVGIVVSRDKVPGLQSGTLDHVVVTLREL